MIATAALRKGLRVTTKAQITGRFIMVARLLIVTIYIFVAIGGNHPPMLAQHREPIEAIPVITTEDALQDDHIKGINDQIKTANDRIDKQFARLNIAESTLAGMQGEERGIGALLGLLSGVQIILQVRKKKEA